MSTRRTIPGNSAVVPAHAGLVSATAACLFVVVLLAGGYAWWQGNALLGALSLQLVLATGSTLAVWHAGRVRGSFRAAWGSTDTAASEGNSSGRWSKTEEQRGYDYESDRGQLREAWQQDALHDRHVHFLFFKLIPTLVVGLSAATVLVRLRAVEQLTAPTQSLVFGLLALALACMWIVLARSFEALQDAELPGAEHLGMVLRESQWTSLLGAAALLGSLLWAPLEAWLARLLLLWLVAVCVEQLARVVLLWRQEPEVGSDPVPAQPLALRQSLLVHGNPLTSLLESCERRFGVSFRSSWTIRFVRGAFLPLLLLSGMLYWGLTCITLIGPSELGVRESFGVADGVLGPGLHGKLPWPFGEVRRFEVKRIHAARLGARSDEEHHRPRAILWSKSHAHEELALVLGTGTDAVSVDALIYYKIREDRAGLLDYAYHTQNPFDALQGYALRCLMQRTRSATLDEVLSVDRAEYARQLEADLRRYVADNHLGIEIVDLALTNLHPPIAAATAYLDVISAQIDATRFPLEAAGEYKARMQEAEKESSHLIAVARAGAARRVGDAVEESAQFVAVGGAYAYAPEAYRLRVSGDTLAEILSAKPLTLVDPAFVEGNAPIMLDLRLESPRGDAAELQEMSRQ